MPLDYTFSELFDISLTEEDDWLDIILPLDTSLFVDPFLIYGEKEGHWAGAHERLIDFFNFAIESMMKSRENNRFQRSSNYYQLAERLFSLRMSRSPWIFVTAVPV